MPDVSSLVSFLTLSSVSLSSPRSLGIYISSQNSDNRVSYLGPWPAPETVPHISQGESLKQHGSTAVWCESSIIQPCLLWATWSYRIAGKISNGANFHIFHRQVNILLYNQFKVYTCVLWVLTSCMCWACSMQQPWYTRAHILIICTLYLFWMHEEISWIVFWIPCHIISEALPQETWDGGHSKQTTSESCQEQIPRHISLWVRIGISCISYRECSNAMCEQQQ